MEAQDQDGQPQPEPSTAEASISPPPPVKADPKIIHTVVKREKPTKGEKRG